jgi:hypothetical protein
MNPNREFPKPNLKNTREKRLYKVLLRHRLERSAKFSERRDYIKEPEMKEQQTLELEQTLDINEDELISMDHELLDEEMNC